MKRKLSFIMAGFVLSGATAIALPHEPLPTQAPHYEERAGSMEFTGVLLARPLQPEHATRFGLSQDEIRARAAGARQQLSDYEVKEYVAGTDEYLIYVPGGLNENQVATSLMASGNFQYVEPDWRVYPVGCPNDGLFNNQWHHNANRMNSCAGWDLHTGNPSTVVAICDTGIRTTHVDFQQHRREGYNSASNLWESQGGQINDINGHGTATSGCAAANGNNSVGVSGVGWNLGHRMMRVTNQSNGSANLSDLTEAARVAADQGDRVASVSYSGVQSNGVDTTGAYCRARNALLVWAAGNDGATLNGNRDDNVIVVGATRSNDTLASFSNRGSFVDLVAPGESVFTTSSSGNNSYGSVSGTSFSCPLTAGLCGLIFSYDPSLTPAEVEQILRNGCDDLGTSGVDNTYGYGRIDVRQSLDMVVTCTPPSNYCFTSSNSASANGSIMDFNGTNSIAANNLELVAYGNPAGQNGIFFHGTTQTLVPFGNGFLCAGGQITRFPVQQIDIFGFAGQSVDVNAFGFQAGDTSNFQFWFRDPMGGGSGFNLSDGLAVPWCP